MLGSGHMEVQCFDGEKRIAHIRGKMRKKVIKRNRGGGKRYLIYNNILF